MITEETIARMKINLEVKNEYFVLDVIKHLEGQIEQLQQAYTITVDKSVIREQELEAQIEKMKSDVQELSNNKYYYLSQHTCKELLRRWN